MPQIKELLTNYGDFPAVIWFDTPTTNMTPARAARDRRTPEPAPQPHLEQPPRRRLQGRHRNARADHPAAGLSRPRLGVLHDHQRHLGLQILRHQFQVHRDAAAQPHRHRQQGRQLPAQRRAGLARHRAPARSRTACAPWASGSRSTAKRSTAPSPRSSAPEAGSFCATEKDKKGEPKFVPAWNGDPPRARTRSTSRSSPGPRAHSIWTKSRAKSRKPTCSPTALTRR